jgi:hypothetical protein
MSANIVTPEPAVTPAVTDPNDDFQPLEAADARKKRYRDSLIKRQQDSDQKASEFFLKLRQELRSEDQVAREQHAQDTDQMCRYFNGDQYGSYVSGIYQQPSIQDGDYAYTIPVTKGHCEQSFMQLLRTEVGYEFSPRNEGQASARSLAKMCETIAVREKNRLMTRDMQMDEIWNSILSGESYRCLVWGVNPESPRMATRLDYTNEEFEIPGRRECATCHETVPEGVATCPKCGSDYIKDIPPATAQRSVSVEKQVPLAENLLHIPHPLSMQPDFSAQKLKYSSFIIERDYLAQEDAQWRYQTIIQPDSAAMPLELRLRHEQERASTQTDPIAGSSRNAAAFGTGRGQLIVREFIYLSVDRYGSFYVAKPETTPDGEKIPVGFLGDTYPDGLLLLFAGNTILKVKGINFNRRWTAVLYGKRAGSNRGSGMHALMPLNDIVNDSFNLDYSLGMTGHPFTAVSRKHVKQLPEAGHLLFVDNLPQSGGIESVIKRFPGSSPSGFFVNVSEKLDSVMQFIEGTYSLQGNVGGPDQAAAHTATGVTQVTENASGRSIGPVNQRISADFDFFIQILQNIQEYCTQEKSPEQYKELEKEFGPDLCAEFFKCNFRQLLNINVAANSDTPRSMALTNAKAMAFGQIAQAFAVPDAPSWSLDVLASIADTLDIPLSIGPGRIDRREAEYRLNKLAAIEERIASKDPNYLANVDGSAQAMFKALAQICHPLMQPIQVNPEGVFMQDHQSFMDVYKDGLFSEEAKTWSMPRKAVVQLMWMQHYDAQLSLQFEQAKRQKEIADTISPPPPQPTPEELAAQQDQEDQRAVAGEMLTRQADEAQKDADLQRRMDEKEHGAELDIAKQQAQQALMPAEPQQNGARSSAS